MLHLDSLRGLGPSTSYGSQPKCVHQTRLRAPAFLGASEVRRRQVHGLHATETAPAGSYNFAKIDADFDIYAAGERRIRTENKKEARIVLEATRGLTAMTPKQLFALSHLLPGAYVVDAIQIAAALSIRNQGRKRQEALVAKMLRTDLEEEPMKRLAEAVRMTQSSDMYRDASVQETVDSWRDGLLANDPVSSREVFDSPLDTGMDHQRLRQLVRQCQQALSEEAAAASLVPEVVGEATMAFGGAEAAESDPLAAAAEAAEEERLLLLASGGRPRSRRRSGNILTGKKDVPPASRRLLVELNKVLKPLAIKASLPVRDPEDDDGDEGEEEDDDF